jgi:heme-degrading monooxygenase HmoA
MFVNVGRFRFRPMGEEERRAVVQSIERDVPPIARASPGFRGVYFARTGDDEVMAVWLWDSAADWEAALPSLQAHVVPNLAQPPERVGGEVIVQVSP